MRGTTDWPRVPDTTMNAFSSLSSVRKSTHWSASVNGSIVLTIRRSCASECLKSMSDSSMFESNQISVKFCTVRTRDGLAEWLAVAIALSEKIRVCLAALEDNVLDFVD